MIPWKAGFPNDGDTYRSHKRLKDEEAERLRRLEDMVLSLRGREKALEARMQEEIKRQVDEYMSSQRETTSELAVNISPLN